MIAGAVDPDPLKRTLFSQTFSAPAFSSVKEALTSVSPKIVVVATPTNEHAKTVKEILSQSRPSIILCEKPLANSLMQAQQIVDACRESGTQLYVNYIRRADSAVLTVKSMLEQKEIQTPFTGVASYGKDIIHNGTHMIDLLAIWFGFPNPEITRSPAPDSEEHDGVSDVTLQFDSGSLTLMAPGLESDDFVVVLHFANGILRYADSGSSVTWRVAADTKQEIYSTSGEVKIESSMNYYQLRVSQEINSAIRGLKTNLCSGEEALKSLEVATQIIRKVWKQ